METRAHRELNLPLMSFVTAEEIARLKASPQWQTESRAAITLTKNEAFTIVLVALHRGAALREHQTDGQLTLTVLDGTIRFRAGAEERVLERGMLAALGAQIKHEVEALEDCAFALTVMRHPS
jgi:quercetin dioxygenase-like cupin family protein